MLFKSKSYSAGFEEHVQYLSHFKLLEESLDTVRKKIHLKSRLDKLRTLVIQQQMIITVV